MSERIHGVLQTFPPRVLAPQERAVIAEWLSLAGDIPLAYVSERRSDDPILYRRIVIALGGNNRPSHTIHAVSGLSCWLRSTVGPYPDVRQFQTLRAALNSIREVLH